MDRRGERANIPMTYQAFKLYHYYIEKCEIFDVVSLCVLQYAGEAGKSILAEVTLNQSRRSGGIFTGKCHISYLGKKNTLKLVGDVFYHIFYISTLRYLTLIDISNDLLIFPKKNIFKVFPYLWFYVELSI